MPQSKSSKSFSANYSSVNSHYDRRGGGSGYQGQKQSFNGGGYNFSGGPQNHGYNSYFRGSQGSRGAQRGRGRGFGGRDFQSNRPQCQVCGKLGHLALACFYRFDESFKGPSQLQNNGVQAQSTGAVQGHLAQASVTPQDVQSQHWYSQDQSWYTPDSDWYPDSGATNHVTSELQNLELQSEYHGGEQLHIGDGKGLLIKHIGHTSFESPFTSHKLDLKHLLHVPEITKNLLSVSKFCTDNNVLFEFHSTRCFVKDQSTRTILLEGVLRYGLYVFDKAQVSLSSPPKSRVSQSNSCTRNITNCKAFISASVPKLDLFQLWHNRLGHPACKVVQNVMTKLNISQSLNNVAKDVCSACCYGKIHKFPYFAS